MSDATPLAASTRAAPAGAGDADAAVIHTARRLSFGPTPDVVAELEAAGIDGWLDSQLDPARIDDTACDRRLWALSGLGFDIGRLLPGAMPVLDATGLTTVVDGAAGTLASADMYLDELARTLPPEHERAMEAALAELRLAAVVRAVYSRRHVLELIVDHWWNHLNVWPGKSSILAGLVVTADRETIRPFALGRFADLLQASASSPAMLVYLDNWTNRSDSPNENYGRELLELHTVGVASGFSEQDVRDTARVFTGWTVDLRTGRFTFVPSWHDTSPKQVMGWSTGGRSGPSGIEEGRSLLDHLAHHPATARTVATSLVRRFVGDDPPPDLVATAADVYLAEGSAITPVLRHIVGHEAFWSSAGTKLRRPLDFFAAVLRATGADIGDPIGPSTAAGQSIDVALLRLGQRPFDAPSPAGYPERAESWLGAGLLGRWAAAHELAREQMEGIRVDHAALIGSATTAGEAVDRLLARLHVQTAPDRRDALLVGLGAGEDDVIRAEQHPDLVALALCVAEAHQR